MSVGMKIYGVDNRQVQGDEAMLKFAERVKVGGKPLKLIQLSLKDGMVRGKMNYRVNCFQAVDVVVDKTSNKVNAEYNTDNKGNATSLYPTSFDRDMFGGRIAYIVDTPYNRDVLTTQYHFDASYHIISETVEESVKKDADAYFKRYKNAQEKAYENAKAKVEKEMATFIKGIEKSIGEGFELSSEYKENVTDKIAILARKNFSTDTSWKAAKKAPLKKDS